MLVEQELKPKFQNNQIILELNKPQFKEICYALELLQKKKNCC